MIRQDLLELQWRQLNHDELYHREIARLSVGDRMKHMTLHLAKYLGHIAEADAAGTCVDPQHLVDVYIICLSAANVVNLDLASNFKSQSGEARTVLELGKELNGDRSAGIPNITGFARDLAIGVGRLAKACESLDHVETFAFRESMQRGILSIFSLVVAECAHRDLDLEAMTIARQDRVRARHIFDGFLRPTFEDAIAKAGLK